MSEALDKLHGITDIKTAQKILDGISDKEILGGNFVGDDLKKKVRGLIRKYHPDIPDPDLIENIKHIITQRINTLGDQTRSRYSGNREEQESGNSENNNSQENNKKTSRREYVNMNQVNSKIQSIYDSFSESNSKTSYDFEKALTELIDIENIYNTNLGITKGKVIEIRVGKILSEFSELNSETTFDFEKVLTELLDIENTYNTNLASYIRKLNSLWNNSSNTKHHDSYSKSAYHSKARKD